MIRRFRLCVLLVVLGAARSAAAAVGGYEVVSESLLASTAAAKSLTVSCPAGKEVLGGGVATLDVDGDAFESETAATIWATVPFGVPPTGWLGAAYTTDSPSLVAWGLRVSVICGDAAGLERVTDFAPLSSNSSKFTQAICPAGKRPLSGGAQTSGVPTQTSLLESVESTDAAYGLEPGWAALARGPAAATWNIQPIALCADELAADASVYESTAVSSADDLVKTTDCPAGLVAVGGSARAVWVGGTSGTDGARLTAVAPDGPLDAPTGWTATARRPAATDAEWRLSVGVVCVPEPLRGELACAAVAALLARRARRQSRS